MKLWFCIFLIPLVCLGQDNVGILDGPISKPLLEDTFATPLSAGSVNGTYSTGRAPGLRTVTDAGNKVSVTSSNTAFFSGISGTTGISYPSQPVVSGRLLKATLLAGSSSDPALWFATANNGVNGYWFDFDTLSSLLVHFGTGSSFYSVGSFSLNTPYTSSLVLRSSGAFYFVKGGAFSFPTMVANVTTSHGATLFPFIENERNASSAFSGILIPKTLWLPSPIASDSFVRANGSLGVTDGNGTQERNGGAGLTWNAPGWVISGNTAIAGNTVVADGVTSGLVGRWQLDTATGATDLSGNGNNGTGQGGISIGAATDRWGVANRATAFSGTGQYIDTPSSTIISSGNTSEYSISAWVNSAGAGSDGNGGTVCGQYSGGHGFLIYVFVSATGIVWQHDVGSIATSIQVPTGKWFHLACVRDSVNETIYFNGRSIKSAAKNTLTASASHFYLGTYSSGTPQPFNGSIVDARTYSRAISSAEVQQIYLAGATALCTNSTANVVAETSFTGPTSQSGLVLNYDGSTGTNLLTSYFDGNGNVKVDQTVNGNTTNLISGAVTYVANARLLTVSAPSEGQVRVYYNNALVNSSTGIWPGFTNFTQHGLYSQGAGSFTNYANFARGTSGEYSIIDTLK